MALFEITALRRPRLPPPAASLESLRTVEARLGGAIEHAVRAPLSRALSAARVLADQVHETQAPAAHSIVDAIEHAEGVLLDMDEFLRNDLDARTRASKRWTNLSRLCERLLDSIQCRYPAQALKFESDRRVEGYWDPDGIAAMTSRLVLNAIQHGTSGTVLVRVHASGFDDGAVVEIWNAGAFSTEVSPQLPFEPFVSASPRRYDGVRGLGLGLYLAARIAHAHGGRIEVETDVREGTMLRVILPCA